MDTRAVARRLYDAYLAGDPEGMMALMTPEVEVRFLGQAVMHGLEELREFLAFSGGLLRDLEFRLEALVVDGEMAAGIWSETATTVGGSPWRNHGVDVMHVRDGRIAALHENNDVRLVRAHLPRYAPAREDRG
jgi:ketosteroid isomerase-like protein